MDFSNPEESYSTSSLVTQDPWKVFRENLLLLPSPPRQTLHSPAIWTAFCFFSRSCVSLLYPLSSFIFAFPLLLLVEILPWFQVPSQILCAPQRRNPVSLSQLHLAIMCVLGCVWLCDPLDCSLPGCFANGLFQARILEWFPLPTPGIFPTQGSSPVSPALAGKFFTTSATWQTYLAIVCISIVCPLSCLIFQLFISPARL